MDIGKDMVEYCPKCNAQLPPGLQKCPICGHKFPGNSDDEFTTKDIFSLSSTILGIVLVPLLIIIGVVLLIIFLFK
jgi:uncharacterized membrane protein YvbJ